MGTLMFACLLHWQEFSVVQLKCAAKVIWEIGIYTSVYQYANWCIYSNFQQCLVGIYFSIAILPFVYCEYTDLHTSVVSSYGTFHLFDT